MSEVQVNSETNKDEMKYFENAQELKKYYDEVMKPCNGFVVNDRDQVLSVSVPSAVAQWSVFEKFPFLDVYPLDAKQHFEDLVDEDTRFFVYPVYRELDFYAKYIDSVRLFCDCDNEGKSDCEKVTLQYGRGCDMCKKSINSTAFYENRSENLDVCFKCAATDKGVVFVRDNEMKVFDITNYCIRQVAVEFGSALDWFPLAGFHGNYILENINTESKWYKRLATVTSNLYCCSDHEFELLPASLSAQQMYKDLVRYAEEVAKDEKAKNEDTQWKFARGLEMLLKQYPNEEEFEGKMNQEQAAMMAMMMLQAVSEIEKDNKRKREEEKKDD